MLQIHEQESSDIHGGDELKYLFFINENNIIEACVEQIQPLLEGKPELN
jgi:hypothetical protein